MKHVLYDTVILPISEDEYKNVSHNLQKYQEELPNNELCFQYIKSNEQDTLHNRKYISESLKRSHVENLWFRNALFDDSSWTNSIFSNVHFIDTPFINSNASYCNFVQSSFEFNSFDEGVQGSNFSYANLVNSKFQHVLIKNSTFDNVSFDNCSFNNCKITESTFEGSVFNNCTFEDVDLSNLNLDFSEFKICSMSHVILPFFQLPYIYGALTYLIHENESIWVSASGTPDGNISVKEYIKLLPELVKYYTYYNEYFPVANIYAALDDYGKSYAALELGIESARRSLNFRMLKFYCKLATTFNYVDYNNLQKIYEQIYNTNTFNTMNPYNAKDYFAQIGEIRRILLFNDSGKTSFEISMQTNIDSSESEKLGIFLGVIEHLLCNYPTNSVIYSIELKHRCPWDVILKIITNYGPFIYTIVQSLTTVLSTGNTFVESIDNLKRVLTFIKNNISSNRTQHSDLQEQLLKSEIGKNNAQTELLYSLIQRIENTTINPNESIILSPEEVDDLQEQLSKQVAEANKQFLKHHIKAVLVYQTLN